MPLRGARHQGAFGSLDNGTARPELAPDALVVSRNTEHRYAGSITKRAGRTVRAEVASQKSLLCAPILERKITDPDGKLVPGFTYFIRATYVTGAGETDDSHYGDVETPGAPTLEFLASTNAAQISVPCHIRRHRVGTVGHDGGGFITLSLKQPDPTLYNGTPVDCCDETSYIGYLVYPRSPRFTDETNLGANPDAAEPLYHRVKPWATVTAYNQATHTYTLDRKLDAPGNTGWLDSDYIDIMMPDRDGLPIRGYNIYMSLNGIDFYLAGTWNTGALPFTLRDFDPSVSRAPSTRVDHTAPAIAAVNVTEFVQGKCGPQPADTRIPASIVSIRTTWTTGDLDLMGDPGFEEQCRLNHTTLDLPPLRAMQETWPSNASYVMVSDGQGILVTPNGEPDINVGWNIYGRPLRPFTTLTFEDSIRPGTQVFSPRRYAQSAGVFYYGDPGADPSLPVNNFADGPDSSFGGGALYDEFRNTSVIISGPLDPFAAATRGYPPGYPDVRETLDPQGDPYFSYASSEDGIIKNRQLYWWHLDSVTDAATLARVTHAILRITFRVRPGRLYVGLAPGFPVYEAGNDHSVSVRVWDEGAAAWTVLESGIGIEDATWFTRRGFPIEWDATMLLTGQAPGPLTSRYLVFDIIGLNSTGFDVDEVQLELYQAGDEEGDLPPHPDEVKQNPKDAPITTPTYTLQNPLVERTYLTDGSNPGQGEWHSIRPNNTAQWPVVVTSLPVVGKAASSKETKVNFSGCADSVFRDVGDSTFERVFQIENKQWNSCMRHDWGQENYYNRIFLWNEGDSRWNYRFDGLATYVMGLPKPVSAVATGDITDGFGTGQGEIPEGTTYNDRCEQGQQFAGAIIAINETDTPEGKLDPDGNLVIGFDLEYYVVYKRRDPATGRSYVVRSEPAQFTRTTRVRGTDDFPPSLLVEGWLSPEPQVTHIEIYRNNFMTADYYLVSDLIINASGHIPDHSNEGILITDAVVDQATARVFLSFTDVIPTDSADLTLPIEFDTGRPTAAVMMKFNRGRVFFAQQKERAILAFTNITSPSGAVNPEGFFVQHVIELPVRESSAITCLSVYNDILIASCNTGMVGVQGISDDLNASNALSAGTLAADGGWMGPQAYCDVDNVQYGMTRQGPARLFGGELHYVGGKVDGTISDATMTTDALFGAKCVHYRTLGLSQVWFSYLSEADDDYKTCLVMEEAPGERGEALWKMWSEMPVHGIAQARDSDGAEYPLLGGPDGRTYQHGSAATDAGQFIEHDLVTRPFESPSPSKSIQPRWAYFYTSGAPSDFIALDLQADFTEIARNAFPIPIQMGGNVGLTWAQAVGGSGDLWGGDGPKPWTNDRIDLGGVFQQIQYRLYNTIDTWRVGASRETTFESTGFNPFDSTLGPRPARAGAGARK